MLNEKGGRKMSKKLFELNVKGIKCDACDYKDVSVELEDYPDYVDKPCPECGANLLTQKDYMALQKLIGLTSAINSIFKPRKGEPEEKVVYAASSDGEGNISFVRKEKEEQ